MAIIQSGATTTLWTIDTTSTAGRVTIYDQSGNCTTDVSSLANTLNALSSSVTFVLGGQSTLGIDVDTTIGSITVSFEATINNINWFALNAVPAAGGAAITTTSANGQWIANTSGFYAVRIIVTAISGGASMIVSAVISPGGSNLGIQSVSGTVTATQGTANTLANAWPVEITDGTNILGTSSHAIRIDPTGSTTQPVSGTIVANAGTGSFTVIQGTAANLNATVTGTVTANIGTTNGLALDTSVNGLLVSQGSTTSSEKGPLVQGAVTTASPSYTTAQTSPLSLTLAGALRTDGTATTQPVSGTITANAGTGTFTVAGTVAATQSGSWSNTVVQPTAANLNATVVGTVAATQSGTWTNTVTQTTASNLNATVIGTTAAGSGASAGLITVQGNASGTAIPISGAITGTGNFTVVQPTASNLNATVVGSGNFTVVQPSAASLNATVTANGNFNNAAIGTTAAAPPSSAIYAGALATTAVESGLTTGDMYPLSLTTTGLLRIDGSNVTQPVNGTITANAGTGNFTVVQGTAANLNATVTGTVAATQNGTWTVQPGNTPNTTPWLATINQGGNSASVSASNALKVDASATTQPVSGTVTANAGTGSFTVVQATAGNLNATVVGSGNFTNASISSTGSAPPSSAALTGASVTTSAPTYTTGQMSALSLTTAGALRTDASATTQPVSGTVVANAGTGNFTVVQATAANLNATVTGTVAATQSGTWTVQPGNTPNTTPWLATINQGGNSATVTASNALKIDGSATTQPVSGTITANAGTGSFTVAQGTAANLNATVVGTVTANIGTTNGLALDTSVNGLLLAQGSTTSGEKGVLIQGAVTTSSPTYTTAQTSPLSLTTAGAVRIDGTATTQPISGTVTANAGTGSFTVVQATAANLNATITGTVAATQSGTWTNTVTQATASNLNATIIGTGTAGSPSAGILTIQGNASGTPVPISGTVTASNPSVSTTAAAPPGSATYIGGSTTTAAPTYTTGQMNALSLNTSGGLRVDGSGVTQPISGTITANAGTGSFTVVQATASNLNATVSGTVTSNIGTTNGLALDASVNGIIVAQGSTTSGEKGTLIQGAVTTSSPTYTTAQTSPLSLTTAGALRTDASATTQPVSGTITANAGTGTFTVGGTVAATQSGTWTSTVTQATAANLNATVVGSGNFTVVQATASSLNATVIGTTAAGSGAATGLVTIQGNASGTAVPVSGTVTATIAAVSATGAAPPASAIYIGGSVTTASPTYTTGQMSALSLTTAGALRIDGTATTQPVSGTITANAGTGSFTVAQATAANLNATVTGTVAASQSGTWTNTVTQATASNLNATVVGTTAAGSGASAGLVTIQGNASGTAVPVSGTITANAGTGSFTVAQATAANLNATVTGTVASTQSGTWTVQPGNTANTTPWLATVNNGGNSAAVKAASTLAVAADPAMVVSLNPASAAPKSTTAAVTQVASATSSTTLLASNANRLGAFIVNASTQILYIKFGTAAATTSFTTVVPITNGLFEVPFGYTGIITGIWPTANGFAYCTECTA